MARPIRVEFPGAIYHVMSRGVDGMPTFRDELDHKLYLERLEKLIKLGVLVVHSFCLMTNHFHLLCETPHGKLSRWMQQLLSRYSGSFNRRHLRVGHLFQARYKAIVIEGGKYFLDCSAYIHLNPVRAGLVRTPEEYPWSSFSEYIGHKYTYGWVSTQKTLSLFSAPGEYQTFIKGKMEGEIVDPFDKAVAGIAFGSKDFAEAIRARFQPRGNLRDSSGLAAFLASPPMSIGHIVECVWIVCGSMSPCQRERVLVYALKRYSGLRGSEIATLIGRSPQSVSEVWRHFENKQNNKLQRLIEGLDRAMGR